MKENPYNNSVFFEKYSQITRSKEGLKGAGEWETLKKMLPSFRGKRMLDLGCGYGWHCVYAMEQGASSVVGIDLSEKMLEVAKSRTTYKEVEYQCVGIEDMEFPKESFDIVFSSLALHYIESFEMVVKKVKKYLKQGGTFVFSVEHPVFTAYGSQDWYYNEQGEILHFPVDNYYYEGERTAIFLGEPIKKYHRTLTTYIQELLMNGFQIEAVVEPMPPEHLFNVIPGMKDEMRRPMMLMISAVKK